VQTVIAPEINAATVRLLERAGAEVIPVSGCCGSLVHHLGREQQSHAMAGVLVERLHAEISGAGLDAIVANASGCGTHAKDLGYVLRNDTGRAAKAAAVSALARDVTETLEALGLPPRAVDAPSLVVAYHSACSMQHGQKLDALPRALLARAGFTVKEVAEGHLCCGSAGTYNILQPELATRLRDASPEHHAHERGSGGHGEYRLHEPAQHGCRGPVVHGRLLDWLRAALCRRPCASGEP
jgi:glycolate oxidase iron-sulfur subunit